MASPGRTDSGVFPSPVCRIPTPLGPNTEDSVVKIRTSSQSSQHHNSINGNLPTTTTATPILPTTTTATPINCQSHHQTKPTSYQSSYQATAPICQPADHCPTPGQSVVGGEEHGEGGDSGKTPATKLTRPQIYTLCAICFANLCSATFYSLLAPFFPTEANKKGATNTEVGIILGVFQAVVFVSSPLFGNYITTFGPRFMFITGTFATSMCVILFGMLQWCPPGTIYVVMCLCVRSVEALAAASTTTSAQAIAAHTFSTRLASVMGILQACSCIGLMVGPPIGGSLYALDGFYLPFVVSGGLFMLGGFVCLILLPSQKAERMVQTGSKLALLKIPLIPIVGYVTAVGQLAMGFMDVALAIHLQQFNLYPAVVGLVFLIPPVMVVILAPIVGWVTDKYPVTVWPFMIVGTVVATAGFLVMGPTPLLPFLPSHTLWLVITGLVVSGVGWSSTVVCFPIFVKAAHDKGFPDSMETQGLVSGVFNAFNSLGALIGPTVGGFLLERYKFPWAATMVAGSLVVAAALLIAYSIIAVLCSQKPQDDQTALVDDEHED